MFEQMLNPLFLLTIVAVFMDIESSKRLGRSAPTLIGMAKKVVPCPFPYMPVPYGCYCGLTFGTPNSGPVDDFDELCKRHDECYAEVEQRACKSTYDEYIAPYSWELIGEKITCSEGQSDCRLQFCECDKLLVESTSLLMNKTGLCPSKDPGCEEEPS